ncbi:MULTISPECIES: SinI family restriction endonuclease [unclassified Pseudomonas]|uniref:SinI family restriction endonuclease n=1 Tax=unclassified Pseudomonas TaxID=196821 RepID=UPI000A1E9B62|nr:MULTISPECIES: SinI family restriction endonuclease [unclassified Pseudomonas]
MDIHLARDPVAFARDAMEAINPDIVEHYACLIQYLLINPTDGAQRKGSSFPVESPQYIEWLAKKFAAGRTARHPKRPQTIPDPMVSVILNQYFDCPEANLETLKEGHLLSMGAENIVGDLLERYLASVLEPNGWVWCSGSTVTAIDFIKPPSLYEGNWTAVQVKNRNNTENSSSTTVRKGKPIKLWHRTHARKTETYWRTFPDPELTQLMSEEGFKHFVGHYLNALKDPNASQPLFRAGHSNPTADRRS